MKRSRKDVLVGDEVTSKPDASKFLMLIPQSQLLCRIVMSPSTHSPSVVLEVRGLSS